jgi:single-stranded DNA-specific DHH superfamily exonuclease
MNADESEPNEQKWIDLYPLRTPTTEALIEELERRIEELERRKAVIERVEELERRKAVIERVEELERRKAVIERVKEYDKILGILASDNLEINLSAYRVGTAVYTQFGDAKEIRDLMRIAIEENLVRLREKLLISENPNLENSVNFVISRPAVDEPTE